MCHHVSQYILDSPSAAVTHLQVGVGVTIEGTECDVSSPASVARLAAHAQDKLGRIDVWINNAGYSGSFQVCVQHLLAR